MRRKTNRPRSEVWMYVKDPAKLRRRRKDKGLSQVQLASLSGCTQQYISLMENGDDRDCSDKIATRIAKWLDSDLEDLFDERAILRMPGNATVKAATGIAS
jgi:putative transcriptional regulator